MTIKSLLIGSAAALAVVPATAHAADAIVAAEPEPVDYVRVCDAYGTGYFYIPGTETCLKIEGYIRFQVDVGPDARSSGSPSGQVNNSDWDAFTRAQVQFTAKSDTEYGPLTGVIVYRANGDNGSQAGFLLDSAFIDIAGFRAGLFYSWWDDGLSGETDVLASLSTQHNSVRYQYEGGSFYAGISIDELEDGASTRPNDVGIAGAIGGKGSGFSYQITGGYDTDLENGAVRAMGTVGIGPGTLGLAAIYASGSNSYYRDSEWAVAAEYAIKATDKLKITPAVQYFGNWTPRSAWAGRDKDDFSSVDMWRAGVTVDYQIVDNFYAKATANWQDRTSLTNSDDTVTGFFRLQRAF